VERAGWVRHSGTELFEWALDTERWGGKTPAFVSPGGSALVECALRARFDCGRELRSHVCRDRWTTRGEGASTQLECLVDVLRSSSGAELRKLNQQISVPPHPQPLSRVGARGADPRGLQRYQAGS
jgi:hypothetical protein